MAPVQVHQVSDLAADDSENQSLCRSVGERPGARRRVLVRCLRRVDLCLVSLMLLGLAACSSTDHHGSATSTLLVTSTITPATSTSTTTTSITTTPPSGPSFIAIGGTYVAGTADGGWLYIRSDGAARLRGPDPVACPACGTASAPIASLDFSLASISRSGGSGYTAQGKVTGTSDPSWASDLSAPATVGSLVSLSVSPTGRLTLNLLPANDVLGFASKSPLYSEVSPCTVQAVTPPILASSHGQQETVAGVSCSTDGEWAAASVVVKGGSGEIDEVVVLAGNGSTWIVVDRPTVCNGHAITPAFYSTACGMS